MTAERKQFLHETGERNIVVKPFFKPQVQYHLVPLYSRKTDIFKTMKLTNTV